ncbi:MAG: glycosyltransferase family 4 protein [Deinococcales bacterium]
MPKPLNIRWATWWPVPYWTDRFDVLAQHPQVKLKIFFLHGQSKLLPYEAQEAAWQFDYQFLSRKPTDAGYSQRIRLNIPNFLPLILGSFDALVMNYADSSTVSAAFAAMMMGKDYIIFSPNTLMDMRHPSKLKESLKKILFQRALAVFVTGPLQKDYALQYQPDERQIYSIGNPVKDMSSMFKGSREDLRRDYGWRDELIILYVGRFSREKGLEQLLQSTKFLQDSGLNIKLVMVGDGECLADLKKLQAELGIDVFFAGFHEGEKLQAFYAMADIFALPSLSEPWGLVVNEAMQFGLPIVISDKVGAKPSLLEEGKNGYSFPVGDIKALSQKLEKLARDPVLRQNMGQYAKEHIQNHSIEAWCEAVVGAINQALAERKS